MEIKKTNIENESVTAQTVADDYAEETETSECAEQEVKETVITLDESTLFIAPVGRLDTVASAELKEKIEAFDYSGKDIELDFTNVEYISSAGLRLLVSLQKQAKAGGRTMVVKNINAVVKEVFRISGFNKAFTVL